jgi:hypothetical protein
MFFYNEQAIFILSSLFSGKIKIEIIIINKIIIMITIIKYGTSSRL